MSTYFVCTPIVPSVPAKTHDEIVVAACKTGLFCPSYRQYQVLGMFPYWTQAKTCAQVFADKNGAAVQIISLYPAGDHIISDTIEPTPADPLTIKDLDIDPYDGVPADTGSV